MAKHTYDWNEWLNGERRTLRQGEDFHISTSAFGRVVRMHARRHGIKVGRVVTFEDTVMFRAYLDEDQL